MNRVICDICGSEYPETADRCPICSYPRQGTEKIAAAGAAETAAVKVKGGQFSAKNVKKRRKAQLRADEARTEKNPNRALWVVIIILLIAIMLVSGYIAVRFLRGSGALAGFQTAPQTTVQPTQTTVPPTVPCAGISVDTTVIALDDVGMEHRIGLKLIPENTTDALSFVSSDPAVVEVTEDGVVIAKGAGQATVTITCGDQTRECTVMCWFPEETTLPPETTAPATEPAAETEPTKAQASGELTLDVTDASCFNKDESFTLNVKLGESAVSRSKVKWSSSDPDVASVENGKVTALGKGTATITAEYEGKKAACVVRCRFQDTSWSASATDVTLGVGDQFRLTVTNDSGETADAIWTMDLDGIVSVKGKTVTGRAPGVVTLTTTVDGVTMSCIVRVK